MVEVSRDGRRVYVTNSLYRAWDEQFYLNYRKFRSFNSSHAPSNPGNTDPAVTPMKAIPAITYFAGQTGILPLALTVAVNVTACPKSAGFREEIAAVERRGQRRVDNVA